MTDYQKQIAEVLPDSLNSQHRQVLAERIERAFQAVVREVGFEVEGAIEAGIKALRGDGE